MNRYETAEAYLKLNQLKMSQLCHDENTLSAIEQSGVKIRHYQNPNLALYDITISSLRHFSHRQKVGVFRHGSHFIESIIPVFLRQQIPIKYKEQHQSSLQFNNELDPEYNFVLWTGENELTGEILLSDMACEEIHQQLTQKKVFSIQILTNTRKLDLKKILLNPYAVVISVPNLFSEDIVTVYMGEKFKALSSVGLFQDMDEIGKKLSVNRPSDLKSTFTPNILLKEYDYFSKTSASLEKLIDRYCFVFDKVSGQRLAEELISNHLVTEKELFAPAILPTWTLDVVKNWWPEADKSLLVIGFLTISKQSFDKNSSLEAEIIKFVKAISENNSWTV